MKHTIKKYSEVVPSRRDVSFDIKRMEDIYEKNNGKIDAPHRHDYFTMLIVISAKGKHIIDFNEFELAAQQIYFIGPGQVHQIAEEEKSYGYVLTFSREFLDHNNISIDFVNDLYLLRSYGYAPPLQLENRELDEILFYIKYIEEEKSEQGKYTYSALGSWLKLLLIKCQNFCTEIKDENTQNQQATRSILKDFKATLELQYSNWHKVSDYAKSLNISPDHLNATISHLTGKTVKSHIQDRIILAAKRMLVFSDLTVKQIALELGFSESSHFSQFFKKCTGVSPSNYIHR